MKLANRVPRAAGRTTLAQVIAEQTGALYHTMNDFLIFRKSERTSAAVVLPVILLKTARSSTPRGEVKS